MTYTIVIDVDNFRAERAYRKGLDELNEIWPQIEHYCQKLEKAKAEREAEEQRAYEEARAEYEKWEAIYYEDEHNAKVFRRWSSMSMWERGARPPTPLVRISYIDLVMKRPEDPRNLRLGSYHMSTPSGRFNSIRNNLKRMYTVANAAIGCYRMTEQDVVEMAAWEDGSRIAKIKEEINK